MSLLKSVVKWIKTFAAKKAINCNHFNSVYVIWRTLSTYICILLLEDQCSKVSLYKRVSLALTRCVYVMFHLSEYEPSPSYTHDLAPTSTTFHRTPSAAAAAVFPPDVAWVSLAAPHPPPPYPNPVKFTRTSVRRGPVNHSSATCSLRTRWRAPTWSGKMRTFSCRTWLLRRWSRCSMSEDMEKDAGTRRRRTMVVEKWRVWTVMRTWRRDCRRGEWSRLPAWMRFGWRAD